MVYFYKFLPIKDVDRFYFRSTSLQLSVSKEKIEEQFVHQREQTALLFINIGQPDEPGLFQPLVSRSVV